MISIEFNHHLVLHYMSHQLPVVQGVDKIHRSKPLTVSNFKWTSRRPVAPQETSFKYMEVPLLVDHPTLQLGYTPIVISGISRINPHVTRDII